MNCFLFGNERFLLGAHQREHPTNILRTRKSEYSAVCFVVARMCFLDVLRA